MGNKEGAGTGPAPLPVYLFLVVFLAVVFLAVVFFLRRAVPVFFAVDFFAAAVLRAGFLFAVVRLFGFAFVFVFAFVFLFATAIVHPSFGLAGCQFTLATSARRSTRIAFETRAVTDEGKVSAFSTCFPFITLNARFGYKFCCAAFSERLDGAGDMLGRLG